MLIAQDILCLEMEAEDREVVMMVVAKISKGVMKSVGAEACNFMCNIGQGSGQMIFHTHIHIIPRFSGDGHTLWGEMKEVPDFVAIAEQIRMSL